MSSHVRDMAIQVEAKHDLTPNEIDAIEDRLYDHNSCATGPHDGQGLGFVIRNQTERMIGIAAGFTWSAASELKQMWVDEAYRGLEDDLLWLPFTDMKFTGLHIGSRS